MRIGFSSFFELRVAVAVSRQTPPERTGARRTLAALLGAPPLQMALLALTVLLVGIGVSIASTTDPQWWTLHFSRLGTFHNSSGATFNTTLIVGGTLVALFARAVGRELRTLERHRVRRGTARLTRILLTAVGVNLALVGCVPLNVNQFVHDRVAASMVLSFAVLLLLSPVMMHRMPKRLLATTASVFVFLFAGGWLFVTAMINLALFEVIGFSAMFAWSGVFVICLGRAGAAHAAQLTAVASATAVASVAAVPVAFTPDAVSAPLPDTAAAPAPLAAVQTDAVVELSAPRADAVPACSPRATRRPMRAVRRALRAASRPASRSAARALPPRGCRESAARAVSRR